MKLRRRPSPPPPVLGEDVVLLLLLGHDAGPLIKGGSVLRQLQFLADGNLRRVADLWREHEDACLREAKRRRIDRPQDADLGRPAFFGEYAVAMVARFPERYGRG